MGNLATTMQEHHGIEISESQEQLLLADLDAILEVNKTLNLTRIDTYESALVLHIEDSLAGLPFINKAPQGRYADIGTGGGFPGVPVAIMTNRDTLLVDSVQKKIKALMGVVEELNLEAIVDGYPGRVEDLAKDMPGKFAVVTARAVSSLASLLELVSPLLKKHGRFVCYKGQPTEEEIKAGKAIQNLVGMKLIENKEYQLSDGSQRTILVFEKVSNPKIKLPRRVGLAQKEPLKPRR